MKEPAQVLFDSDMGRKSQQIPLNEKGTWMLTGTLPKAKDADFNVQVIKLPDGDSIPQTGAKIKSTFDGHWSFEPAKFAGYGSYEIKAIGLLNGDSLVRTVTVTCFDKATAYKLSIEREKKFRAGSNIVNLPAGATTPDQAMGQISQLQNEFLAIYGTHQPTAEEAQEGFGDYKIRGWTWWIRCCHLRRITTIYRMRGLFF